MAREYTEEDYKQGKSYEAFLMCKFLDEQDSEKAKEMLKIVENIKNGEEWGMFKLNLIFKVLLQAF